MRLPVFNLKLLRLLYIHFLFDDNVEESCLHIHLVHLPLHLSYKSYDGPDRSVSGHRSECLFIVNAFLLGKATSDKSRFILLNTSINSVFYFEEPSVGYPIFILSIWELFPILHFSLWIGIPLSWHPWGTPYFPPSGISSLAQDGFLLWRIVI
jgi:hypothetical protein